MIQYRHWLRCKVVERDTVKSEQKRPIWVCKLIKDSNHESIIYCFTKLTIDAAAASLYTFKHLYIYMYEGKTLEIIFNLVMLLLLVLPSMLQQTTRWDSWPQFSQFFFIIHEQKFQACFFIQDKCFSLFFYHNLQY